jgi:hypothetical protein
MKAQSSGQADGPTGILAEDCPIYPRPKLGLQLGPRKQAFGFVWFSYKQHTHRRTTAGPMGRPQLQGLAPGKDQVDKTTLGPPTNAGGGGVRVNLVQTGWCELKPRGYQAQTLTGSGLDLEAARDRGHEAAHGAPYMSRLHGVVD